VLSQWRGGGEDYGGDGGGPGEAGGGDPALHRHPARRLPGGVPSPRHHPAPHPRDALTQPARAARDASPQFARDAILVCARDAQYGVAKLA